ncbi:MAG: fumarylacetoacetate hydrolase family protein [Candidatus Protistobacter heckmanni]|nr:fumarylacetoacetate hydrolase family protein [Candidatus Protistobacter heckmanni]
MKLLSFRHQGRESYGIVDGDKAVDLAPLAAELGADLRGLLASGKLAGLKGRDLSALPGLALADIEFLPVIPNPEKIFCVGINYLSHVLETGNTVPKFPMIFTRFADSQAGHLQPMIRPLVSEMFDFEGELAVIIGKSGRHIKAADALSHVAGYSCYNDGSVRDWQKRTSQFIPGKNFSFTGGFGPWLVTTDDIPDPSKLKLQTRLNGQVVQDASTDDLIFPIATLVEYCSDFTNLYPGDVIITGTTGGVGWARTPPLWMKHGDTVEVEISGIGVLRNPVADEKA